MSETSKKSDISFSILTLDIVTNILGLSDDPGKLGQYLTEEIRELTGARTVVIVQCLHKTGKAEHRIVTVNPQRRQNITESPNFESLINITHNLEDITWWHQDGNSGKAEKILADLGLGLSMAIPLNAGASREGAILLFDMPQERHLGLVIEMLRMLSPVVALILRNSFLYTQQENIIAERTSQLEKESIEREQLMKTLKAKNKELQSIVYVASHDLRSPLVNIKGFSGELMRNCQELTELLKTKKLDKEQRAKVASLLNDDIPQDLSFIESGTDKIHVLIEGLLRVSRVGTSTLNIQAIDMNQLIQQVLQTIDYQARQCGATITADHLPDCLADSSRTNQIFSNLLDNALKYLDPSRPGQIHISGSSEDDMSTYCVEDNGIGIPQAHQEKIFEIFHRLNPASPAGGEGLGLTIVTRILDRLNGSISLESETGKGTKFFVTLPTANA